MTMRALTRPARTGRTTTQWKDARRSRRTLPAYVGRSATRRPVARWSLSEDGRLVRTWTLGRPFASSSTAREDAVPDPDASRSRSSGARARPVVMP